MPHRTVHPSSILSPFVLAPMAELSDPPLRRLLARLGGGGLHYTAMITAPASRALRNYRFCIDTGHDLAPPLVTQIAPNCAEEVPHMIENVLCVCRPQALDINMGCPVWWMRSQGAGAALLSDPARAFSIVAAARAAWTGPLHVKIRAGVAEDLPRLLDFSAGLADHGADVLVLHGRLVEERLRRVARWDLVAALVAASKVPVMGNGDILTPQTAVRRLAETGAYAVMIGRGVLRDPFLLARSAALHRGEPFREPSFDQEAAVRLELIDDIAATYEPGRAASRIRKLAPYLLDRLSFGRRASLEIGRCSTPIEQRARLLAFLEKTAGHCEALEDNH